MTPLSRDDVETIRGWRNDAREALRTPFLLTAEMQTDFYDKVVCNRDAPHRYWALVAGPEDADHLKRAVVSTLVGMGGLTNIQWENGLAEISLFIDPDLAGKGLGIAAVDLLLEEAFDRMRLDAVCGECYFCNPAGVNFWNTVVAAHGGTDVTLPLRKFWRGQSYGSMYFTLTAEAWSLRKGKSPA